MLRHPLAHPSWECLARPVRPANRARPSRERLAALAPAEEGARGELARSPSLARIEAALLLAQEPLTARRLAGLAGLTDAAETRVLVGKLRDLYEKGGSAFQVEELAGGYQLLTRPELHPWLAQLRRSTEAPLSAAAREALAIVAYRQPITRADIEAIRGVQSGDVLRLLMEKGLVRIAGKEESLGRPLLYGTTRLFLQAFGLKSLRDLPQAEGLTAAQGRKKAEAPEKTEEGEASA